MQHPSSHQKSDTREEKITPGNVLSGIGRGRWALIGVALVVVYYLWSEHYAHAMAWLPYALLLVCPLLHVFMPHGHGRHASRHSRSELGDGAQDDLPHRRP